MRNLIDSIGRPQFEVELMCHLRQVCRAEHLHVFELIDSQPRVMASLSYDGSSFAELLLWYLALHDDLGDNWGDNAPATSCVTRPRCHA